MATLYVSNSASNGYALGNDVNNGLSKSTPKLSIEAAITASANGDTIVVNDGVYVAASNFVNGKNTAIVPETAYAVTLRATSGSSVFHFNNASGAQMLGQFVVDTAFNAIANGITRGNPSGDIDWKLDGTRIAMGSASAVTDYSTRGSVHIDIEITGSGGSFGYLGSTSAGQLADKSVTISRIAFGDFTTGSGMFVGCSVTRHGTSPAGTVTADISGITGDLRAITGVSGSVIIGVQTVGLNAPHVHDNVFAVHKDGLTASSECLGVNVRSATTTAKTADGRVYNNRIGFFAPSGSAILAGQSSTTDTSDKILVYDNEVFLKYYPVATPHGVYMGGLGPNSAAYRNTVFDGYVGIIMSICQGTRCFNNITDGIYGVDLYAKGNGATAPIFANNTLIKRNRVGDMRAELGALGVNVQGATANTDTLFTGNRVVGVDMAPRMVYVAASQSATFARNGYPKASVLAADSFNWQGTTMDAAAWAAAHESDMVHEFGTVAMTTDGKMSDFSRLAHVGKAVTGVTDSGEEDPFGNEFATAPNIGADQGAAKGFGPWTPFDTSMPALALASTAPGKLLEVQEWTRSDVTKEEMP